MRPIPVGDRILLPDGVSGVLRDYMDDEDMPWMMVIELDGYVNGDRWVTLDSRTMTATQLEKH